MIFIRGASAPRFFTRPRNLETGIQGTLSKDTFLSIHEPVDQRCNLVNVAFLFLIALTVYFAFAPALTGPFMLDDEANIYGNQRLKITEITPYQLQQAASVAPEGYSYARGLAFISFALNYYFSGEVFDPGVFKVTNLVIHIFNAIIAFLTIRLVLRQFSSWTNNSASILALIIALAWACHPIQVSSVVYAVQRMTLVATTTVLLGCYLYAKFRCNSNQTRKEFIFLTIACTLLTAIGFHFKETALLLPFYIFSLEILFSHTNNKEKKYLILISSPIALSSLFGVIYLFINFGSFEDGYVYRNFTLEERTLSQTRILFFYLNQILIPDLSKYSLFFDNYPKSLSLLNPLTTLASSIAWAVIVISAAIGIFHKKLFVFSSTVAWFLGGHLMESTILHLELVFEHRNYLPSLGPIALAITALSVGLKKISEKNVVTVGLPVAVLATLLLLTSIRSSYWGSKELFIEQSIRNRPFSARSLATAGLYQSIRKPLVALGHFETAAMHNPAEITPLYGQHVILNTAKSLYDKTEFPDDGTEQLLTIFKEHMTKSEIESRLQKIEESITDILIKYPISAQTTSTLDRAVNCQINLKTGCINTTLLIHWLDLMIQNPNKQRRVSAIGKFQKARMMAYTGNIDEARRIMESVVNDYPDLKYFNVQLKLLETAIANHEAENQQNRSSPML